MTYSRPLPIPLARVALWSACMVFLTAASVSCAFLREAIGLGPQKPKVQLAEIEVIKAGLSELELAVTLRVDNPNSFDLSFSKLRYKMTALATEVASGTYDDKIVIPQGGHSLIKLPLKIDAVAALRLAHEFLTNKEETYAVIAAVADFDTPFGAMEVSFEDKRPLRQLAGL